MHYQGLLTRNAPLCNRSSLIRDAPVFAMSHPTFWDAPLRQFHLLASSVRAEYGANLLSSISPFIEVPQLTLVVSLINDATPQAAVFSKPTST